MPFGWELAIYFLQTLSKNPVIYHRGLRSSAEGRSQRAQSFKTVPILAGFSDASVFSAYSAVTPPASTQVFEVLDTALKLKDIAISLEFSIVPYSGMLIGRLIAIMYFLARKI